MGWSHLINDKKISEVREYLSGNLTAQIKALSGLSEAKPFAWEERHCQQGDRLQNKIVQFIVNLAVFVVPGLFAIGSFWLYGPRDLLALHIFAGVEVLGLLFLVWKTYRTSDLTIWFFVSKGNSKQAEKNDA